MESFGFHDGNIYDRLETRRFDVRQVFSHVCDNWIIADVISLWIEFVFELLRLNPYSTFALRVKHALDE